MNKVTTLNFYKKSLDGLRGLASLNVALSHFFGAFLPTVLHSNYPNVFHGGLENAYTDIIGSPLATIFFNGHFAVLLFFVLSGYVLSLPYYHNINYISLLKSRIWRRFFRLNLPIIAAVFISFFVYEFIGYSNIEAGRVSGSQWLVNFLKPNLTLNQAAYEAFYGVIIDGAANFVPPLWTIKIEFFGSLYVLFYLIAKPKDKFILSLFIVFIFILLNHSKDEAMYILALFSGAFLPVVKNIRRIHALLLFFLGLYFAAFQYDSFFYNFLPTIKFFSLELSERKNIYNFFGAIFMIIAVSNGVASRLLNSNVCALLGRLSYSIYLVHFVVICSFSSCLYLLLPKSFGYLLLNLLFYIVVLIVFASIFERYIDRTSVALSRFLFR